MRIRNQKDFWGGLMIVAFGAFFASVGMQYTIGTAARMGPGYFPTALGIILILLGIVIAVGSLSAKAPAKKVDKFDLPILLLILGSTLLFGLLLKPLGLIISVLGMVIISSYASQEFTWKATLVTSAVLIVTCLVVFVWGLKLPFPIWPSFISN